MTEEYQTEGRAAECLTLYHMHLMNLDVYLPSLDRTGPDMIILFQTSVALLQIKHQNSTKKNKDHINSQWDLDRRFDYILYWLHDFSRAYLFPRGKLNSNGFFVSNPEIEQYLIDPGNFKSCFERIIFSDKETIQIPTNASS